MPESPRRILQAGPPPESIGGMAQVASLLTTSPVMAGRGLTVQMVDSGGGRGRGGYAAYPAALARALRGDYDLLHLHVASGGSVVRKAGLARAAALRGRPFVVHLHGGGFETFLERATPRQASLARWLFTAAARVVVLGDVWADVVTSRLGVHRSRVEVVPNGVQSLAPDPLRQRRHEIVFVGGVTRAKGVDLLVDVLGSRVGQPEWAGWTVVLVGPEKDPEISRRLDELERRAPSIVERTGPLFGADKAERVARSSVFVLPSRAEGLPLVVLEAMSCAVACVATDVGSTGAVIEHGQDGILVPAENVESLGEALDRLVSDVHFRTELGEQGYQTWRDRFSADVMAARMSDVWTTVLTDQLP